MTTPDKNDRFGRRELLQRGALAGLGVGLAPLRASAQPAARAGITRQPIDRTTMPTSGHSRTSHPNVVADELIR